MQEELAKRLYECWAFQMTDPSSVPTNPPTWENLTERQQDAWRVVGSHAKELAAATIANAARAATYDAVLEDLRVM